MWLLFFCICIQIVSADKVLVGSTFPGAAEVINVDTGEKKSINSLLAESPYTLFLLMRHYAWPPCHNHIQDVENSISEFQQLGCKVVLLANGTREDGLICRKAHPSQPTVYCDPHQSLYRQLGLRRVLKFLTTTVMCMYGEQKMKGLDFPDLVYEDDDLWIMGGDFLVKSDGNVLFALHQTTYYERPSVSNLISCLKEQLATHWTNACTTRCLTVQGGNYTWSLQHKINLIASDWLNLM